MESSSAGKRNLEVEEAEYLLPILSMPLLAECILPMFMASKPSCILGLIPCILGFESFILSIYIETKCWGELFLLINLLKIFLWNNMQLCPVASCLKKPSYKFFPCVYAWAITNLILLHLTFNNMPLIKFLSHYV